MKTESRQGRQYSTLFCLVYPDNECVGIKKFFEKDLVIDIPIGDAYHHKLPGSVPLSREQSQPTNYKAPLRRRFYPVYAGSISSAPNRWVSPSARTCRDPRLIGESQPTDAIDL